MGRRITILGMGPSALRKADVIEQFCEGTEVWSLNNAYLMYPQMRGKFARFFELHSWEYLKSWTPGKYLGEPVDHWAMLEQQECPVYSMGILPIVTNQKTYPAAEVVKQFSASGSLEIKGSPSWMLALALYEHANGDPIEYIQSWGIDTSDPSHECQRPSWAQWTLRAEMSGIEIGGTALEFRKEPDNDAGLNGLLEYTLKHQE